MQVDITFDMASAPEDGKVKVKNRKLQKTWNCQKVDLSELLGVICGS